MKHMKKIICWLLVLVTVLSLFSGCAAKKNDDEIYLTRGEFFSYIVYENNLSSDIYTVEDIQNSKDGAVEAAILAEWGLIDDKAALEKLSKPVDRETVVSVCARLTDHLKTGDPAAFKDADLLQDPQLIADAYASGLTELENGYFSGARKMTFADCEAVWDKSCEYTANFHFETDTEKYEIADDLVTFDPEDYEEGDIIIESLEQAEESQAENEPGMSFWQQDDAAEAVLWSDTDETAGTGRKANASATLLGHANSQTSDYQVSNTNSSLFAGSAMGGFTARLRKDVYERKLNNPKVGDTVCLPRYDMTLDPFLQSGVSPMATELIGILKSVNFTGMEYICVFEIPSFEPAVEKKNVTEANHAGFKDFKAEVGEYLGWKLDFNFGDGQMKISAKKDFTIKETGRKQDWQNATKTITATATFTMSDFNVDAQNLRSFANKRGTGSIKITYDSSFDFSLSTSLRYTPDDNRNGKFPSNWNNSRWTDSDSKGAKSIKIARFTPSLYGVVGGDIYIYLRISIDGKISFGTSIENGGFEIKTSSGKISRRSLGNKKDSLEASANLVAKLGVEASLTIFSFIKVITYDLGLQLDLLLIANLYYENTLKSQGVFADEEGLTEYASADSKFNYCLGVSFSLDVIGNLKDSGVKLILDCLKKGTSLDFKYHICSGILHYEDGHFVDACTRGENAEDNVAKSKDDDVTLSTYKVTVPQYCCSLVYLKSVPSETLNLYDSKNSVTVESLDESIVKVSYNKKNASISIEAVGVGSTEIVIHAKKGILWWKETADQKISVTVTENHDSTTIIA